MADEVENTPRLTRRRESPDGRALRAGCRKSHSFPEGSHTIEWIETLATIIQRPSPSRVAAGWGLVMAHEPVRDLVPPFLSRGACAVPVNLPLPANTCRRQ